MSELRHDKRATALVNTTSKPISKSKSNSYSHFLELAPELRNCIYEYAASNSTTRARAQGRLVTDCQLLAVSRQVGDECKSIIYHTAEIRAPLKYFNFDPVITFLKRLSLRQKGGRSKQRSLVLEFSDIFYMGSQDPRSSKRIQQRIRRWMNFLALSQERGCTLETSYTCSSGSSENAHETYMGLDDLKSDLTYEAGAGPREETEMQKIVDAADLEAELRQFAETDGAGFF